MDTSARFFGKLRNLAVNLETETASLQQAHQNNNGEDRDVEVAVCVLHELHTEVRALKGQVKKQLRVLKAEEDDTRSFITKCMVLKQRTTEDIQRLRMHFEKYGYKAPMNTLKNPESSSHDSDASAMEDELGEEGQMEVDGHQPSVTPQKMPHLAYVDPMRTPQLSDFGLSEIHLKRVCGGAVISSVETPTPMRTFPPSLAPAMALSMPKTPKCMLSMDEDDELQTPRIVDFGLSEHTMCLNNDFTMDLQRKRPGKPLSVSGSSGLGTTSQRPAHVLSTPPSNPMAHHLASMKSPEAPVFSTPGLKITELPRHAPSSSPPLQGGWDPESPCRHGTPEVPAFETPYISRLLGARKDERDTRTDEGPAHLERPVLKRGSNPTHSCDMPGTSDVGYAEDRPEMPSLESFLGSSLSSRKGAGAGSIWLSMGAGEPPLLENDGPTQTFNLGTPLVRGHCSEPSTPEMPDLSSVTQDIFKLISQSKKLPTAVIQSQLKPSNIHNIAGKENRAQRLAVVSEMEFLSLPSYLRQIPLSNLNQAIQKINRATEEQAHGGDLGPAGFSVEELTRITGVGIKARLYFLCLTELKRLEHVQGVGTSTEYKVLIQTQ